MITPWLLNAYMLLNTVIFELFAPEITAISDREGRVSTVGMCAVSSAG